MHIDCLGASGEVGRSAFLLQTDKKIMLDYGIKIFDKEGIPKFPVEAANPDYVILSHAHLDHSGCVPAHYQHGNIKWYGTPPTRDICELLWKDSMKIMGDGLPYRLQHYKKALKHFSPVEYRRPVQNGETEFTFHDAGHISGAAMVDIKYKGRRLLYSGDFKCEDTFMHKGAKYVEDVDTLIIETTYANREHPVRSGTERVIVDHIKETIDNGGNAMFPAFAVGRTQELIALVRNYIKDIPVYVDGMGKDITKIYMKYPRFLRDAKALNRAVRSVNMVAGIPDKKAATREPSVIISTAGMLNGGPMLNYLYHTSSQSKIIFTGYCVEETNGWYLQNKGYIMRDGQELDVDLPVEYLDLSAHAGRADILNFIKHANPEKIVLVHGDNTQGFCDELTENFGYDAVAPKPGDRIEV